MAMRYAREVFDASSKSRRTILCPAAARHAMAFSRVRLIGGCRGNSESSGRTPILSSFPFGIELSVLQVTACVLESSIQGLVLKTEDTNNSRSSNDWVMGPAQETIPGKPAR